MQPSEIPLEILTYIISFVPEEDLKNIAMVSKSLNKSVELSLASLFQSYSKSNALQPYITLANKKFIVDPAKPAELNLEKVRFIFQAVMKEAHKMGYKKEPLSMDTVSAYHLQYVLNWMDRMKNLISFAKKIPILDIEVVVKSDLPDSKKAVKIKELLKKNKTQLEKMVSLDLTGCKLTAFPREIDYFKGLQKLDLTDNNLTTLPPEIGSLSLLKRLILERNQLHHLPTEITKLTQLQILSLNRNIFTAMPSEIWALTQLRELYIQNNQLVTIPSEITSLTLLKVLFATDNLLSVIPDELNSLTRLDHLNFSNNPIVTFPRMIASLLDRGHGEYF